MPLIPLLPEQLVLLLVLLPLAALLPAPLLTRLPNLRDGWNLLVGFALLATALSLLDAFWQGARPVVTLWTWMPGLPIRFALEPVGMLFVMVAATLWPITTLYGIGYMRGNNEAHQTRFFACFAIAITCAMGIALSENLVTTFLFYEGMTLGTLPLVTHAGTPEARSSGKRYLGILMGTSIGLLLPAILWTYHLTGSTSYREGGLLAGQDAVWMGLLLAMFMFGTGKAALMPFHKWLPAAMVAPTPVSALLHAVAVVKGGVFVVVKIILYVFGTETLMAWTAADWWVAGWLPYVSGLTVVLASTVALQQDNLKLRLAYSTISQLAYITMAASLLLPYAVLGAALHIAAHAFGKITLFFVAGAIYTASKKKYVSELDGIGRAMPITMIAFSIAALSMIGLPPTVGFLSKWYMLKAAMQAEHWFVLGVFAISTVLNAAYLLPIIYHAFFKPMDKRRKAHGEAPLPILIALSLTAIGVLALMLFPDLLLSMEGPLLAQGSKLY